MYTFVRLPELLIRVVSIGSSEAMFSEPHPKNRPIVENSVLVTILEDITGVRSQPDPTCYGMICLVLPTS